MKLFLQIILILIVFFKTGNLLSENNLFTVNNIQLEKKDKTSHNILANQAVKKGFNQLLTKILLKEDVDKLSDMKLSSIKQLVNYYQVSNKYDEEKKDELINFSFTFDKDKIHNLFYKKGISYSEILDKELYVLPILIKENEIYIFNNNFFYQNWNNVYENYLIEFILPLENIEIIQRVYRSKNSLININIDDLFKGYLNKNIALIIIENSNIVEKKIYLKTKIQNKIIAKNLNFKKQNTDQTDFNKKIITDLKKEIINLVKSRNLIDIRVPSFINAKLDLNKKSNLVDLHSRMKNIDLIENIYVQEFNKDYVNVKIKYLGKLEKIIYQLERENIKLQLINDQWVIKTL
tara:strand:- start:251 stop:1297 length:1047 start_codon:yes stop_codon:yes gene_type:complete